LPIGSSGFLIAAHLDQSAGHALKRLVGRGIIRLLGGGPVAFDGLGVLAESHLGRSHIRLNRPTFVVELIAQCMAIHGHRIGVASQAHKRVTRHVIRGAIAVGPASGRCEEALCRRAEVAGVVCSFCLRKARLVQEVAFRLLVRVLDGH